MSKRLDIDQDNELWLPAYINAISGNGSRCPRCGSKNVVMTGKIFDNRSGFLLLTCKSCNKSGYFSRVQFPDGFEFEKQ